MEEKTNKKRIFGLEHWQMIAVGAVYRDAAYLDVGAVDECQRDQMDPSARMITDPFARIHVILSLSFPPIDLFNNNPWVFPARTEHDKSPADLLDRFCAGPFAQDRQRLPCAYGRSLLNAAFDQFPGLKRVIALLHSAVCNAFFPDIQDGIDRIGHASEFCPLFSCHFLHAFCSVLIQQNQIPYPKSLQWILRLRLYREGRR